MPASDCQKGYRLEDLINFPHLTSTGAVSMSNIVTADEKFHCQFHTDYFSRTRSYCWSHEIFTLWHTRHGSKWKKKFERLKKKCWKIARKSEFIKIINYLYTKRRGERRKVSVEGTTHHLYILLVKETHSQGKIYHLLYFLGW